MSQRILTWSRKPIPVETLMVCTTDGPGAQSRSIVTSICVSSVLRENLACLGDMSGRYRDKHTQPAAKEMLSWIRPRSTTRIFSSVPGRIHHKPSTARREVPRRLIFNVFSGRSPPRETGETNTPILTEDNLFHPFSISPFPAVRARGDAIKSLAPCPVCSSSSNHSHTDAEGKSQTVKFECPGCGWPTHCSEEHWKEDKDHVRYCSRLREANEDEHDLRSGRRMREFELPGTLWYTILRWHRSQILMNRIPTV